MDFHDSDEIASLRADLRAWLYRYRQDHDLSFAPHDHAQVRRWHRDLAAAGYVATSFPSEYGGRGLPPIFDAVVNQELAAAQAPPPPPIAHLARAIADFAGPELRAQCLPGLLSCGVQWCQGFSEPQAGSDLASVTTRGRVEGETVRVDGHKIWTSGAIWADQCLLFLRTEPDLPKHRGLSMIVVDMASPGIDVRPIVLSNEAREFAEVYFDGVEVPIGNLVGERGQGWAIAMHMLAFERGPADMGWTGRYARDLARAWSYPINDPSVRQRLVRAEVGVRVLDWHVQRTLAGRSGSDGAQGSIDKLLATRVEQDLYRVIVDAAGAAPLLGEGGDLDAYLWSRAQSIYGGAQQIQRNVVAQRILGLPRPRS